MKLKEPDKCPYKARFLLDGKESFYCSYYNELVDSSCYPYFIIETLYTKNGEVDTFKAGFYCSRTCELIFRRYFPGIGDLKKEEVEYLSKIKEEKL